MTDRRRLADEADPAAESACLLRQVRYAVEAGVDVVQVRERDLEARALTRLVEQSVDVARASGTRVVVNDRLDVAIAAGAAGVHLPGRSIPPAVVRRIAPPGFLIGCSVHGLEEARAVWSDADYLFAGTVWESASKGRGLATLGLEAFAVIARESPVPVLAIGGVTLPRLRALAAAGAIGAAAIGLFMESSTAAGRRCRAVPLEDVVRGAREV